MDETRKKLTFRGGMFFSLVPVVIYVFFCVVLFIIFKAFNMEALAVGGFIALLVGGLFCTSYSEFWDSAVRGISSITSVSVVVILLLTGMFSQLIKICGLSGGFVWLANSFGIRGGLFVAFTFLATCIVSTATGSSIGTMFIAFPIFYPAGLILGANPMWMAGCIVSGAVFGDNLAPISDTTIASSSTQQFHDGRPADIGGVVSSRVQYSAVAGLITIVFFAIVGGIGGTYRAARSMRYRIRQHWSCCSQCSKWLFLPRPATSMQVSALASAWVPLWDWQQDCSLLPMYLLTMQRTTRLWVSSLMV